MKKLIVSIVFSLIVLATNEADSTPKILGDHVEFDNGIKLIYLGSREIFADPYEAREKGLPIRIEEKPVLVDEWKRVFLVKSNYYFEDVEKIIYSYDYDGNLISPPLIFTGEVRVLTTSERILLFQKSSHHSLSKSYLLDSSGRLLKMLSHAPAFEYGISFDERIIWFLSRKIINGVPITMAEVFDANGAAVLSKNVEKKMLLEFDYEGEKYEIEIDIPRIPG